MTLIIILKSRSLEVVKSKSGLGLSSTGKKKGGGLQKIDLTPEKNDENYSIGLFRPGECMSVHLKCIALKNMTRLVRINRPSKVYAYH